MMKIDGYYMTGPILFDERKDPNNKWYAFLAYWFLEDGTYLKAVKFSKDENSVKFIRSDFEKMNSALYEFKNGQLIFHLNKGKPWEEKKYTKKTGCGEFEMKSGIRIKFKAW